MATPLTVKTQLVKLKSQLLTSGLQQKDQPLYQVINALIDAILAAINSADEQISGGGGGGGGGGLANQNYLTSANNLASLPNSRQLLAGGGIAFDDSVFGERTVSVNGTGGYFTPLTDGDPVETDLIFTGDGEAIMVFVPVP